MGRPAAREAELHIPAEAYAAADAVVAAQEPGVETAHVVAEALAAAVPLAVAAYLREPETIICLMTVAEAEKFAFSILALIGIVTDAAGAA